MLKKSYLAVETLDNCGINQHLKAANIQLALIKLSIK
jgi:hypothetical protein